MKAHWLVAVIACGCNAPFVDMSGIYPDEEVCTINLKVTQASRHSSEIGAVSPNGVLLCGNSSKSIFVGDAKVYFYGSNQAMVADPVSDVVQYYSCDEGLLTKVATDAVRFSDGAELCLMRSGEKWYCQQPNSNNYLFGPAYPLTLTDVSMFDGAFQVDGTCGLFGDNARCRAPRTTVSSAEWTELLDAGYLSVTSSVVGPVVGEYEIRTIPIKAIQVASRVADRVVLEYFQESVLTGVFLDKENMFFSCFLDSHHSIKCAYWQFVADVGPERVEVTFVPSKLVAVDNLPPSPQSVYDGGLAGICATFDSGEIWCWKADMKAEMVESTASLQMYARSPYDRRWYSSGDLELKGMPCELTESVCASDSYYCEPEPPRENEKLPIIGTLPK